MPHDDIKYRIEDSDGNGKFNEGDDLKPEVRESIGEYLSESTKGTHGSNSPESKNYYTMEPESIDFDITDEEGHPAPITVGSGGSTKRFLDYQNVGADSTVSDEDAKSYFSGLSGGTTAGVVGGGIFSQEELDSLLDKNSQADGHTLLVDHEPIKDIVCDSVLTRNRFTIDQMYGPKGGNDTMGTHQTKYGSYDAKADAFKVGDLSKIGLAMMLKATGEFIPGDPTSGGIRAGAMLPGLAQLGVVTIDSRNMYAGGDKVASDAGVPYRKSDTKKTDAEVGLPAGSVFAQGEMMSYGAMTNFADKFAGPGSLGMTLLAPILTIAVAIAVKVFSLLIFLLIKTKGAPVDPEEPMPLGAASRESSIPLFLGLGAFGFNHTKHDFKEAVQAGEELLFNDDGGMVSKAKGYYAILARSLLRAVGEIIKAFADLFGGGGLMDILAAIENIIYVIKNSRLVAYMNVLAGFGDVEMTLISRGYETDGKAHGGQQAVISEINSRMSGQRARVAGGRYQGNTLTRRWGAGKLPYAALVSTDFLNANETFNGAAPDKQTLGHNWGPGDVDGTEPALLANYQLANAEGSNKLTIDQARGIEAQLDAEYMPFYFHDLRTNEILSFHAFLTSLDDSFSVNWDSSNAYGRVDPVMIYNNTQRSITLAFHVVATSPEDFDAMWNKINKLVTLIYPQWSKGTMMAGENGNFTMPFSQIPTASPLVRLRLGDLFKTNYSRFALSRLFGIGQKENTLVAQVPDSAWMAKYQELKEIAGVSPEGPGGSSSTGPQADQVFNLQPGVYQKVDGVMVPLGGFFSMGTAGNVVVNTETPVVIGPWMGIMGPPAMIGGFQTSLYMNFMAEQIIRYRVKALDPDCAWADIELAVTFNSLRPNDTALMLEAINGSAPTDVAELIEFEPNDAIAAVFAGNEAGDDANPIVRSFESTVGQGLAGAITSLGFNWYDATWETSAYGKRAPQACQVNISFSPIHDIPPGLAWDGTNRAPVYGIGAEQAAWQSFEENQSENLFNAHDAQVKWGLEDEG